MIKCTLDEDECIDLLTVLRVINQINQEQAWAICYQLGALMQRLSPVNCSPIEGLGQIRLHKDGFVHEKSCTVLVVNHHYNHHHHHHHHHSHHHHHLRHDHKPNHQHQQQQQQQRDSFGIKQTLSLPLPLNTNCQTKATKSTNNNNLTSVCCDTTNRHDDNDDQDTDQCEHNNNNKALIITTSQQQANTKQQPQTKQLTTTLPTPPTPPITPELNEILKRRPALNESELVASLGIALFLALDYGIPDDEERKLSIAMEYLIFQSQSELSLREVLEICINRLPIPTKSHADSHYREVCKSLINDTIELSIFLERIYTASMVLSDITLDDCLEATKNNKCDISSSVDKHLSKLGEPLASLRALRINDWARLWMQVIRELRQRGKFKQAAAATAAVSVN